MAKERNKALRWKFRAQETDKGLLQEECSRLKARVNEVEGAMKETLEFVNKLQVDLEQANTSKSILRNRAKTVEDQVAML